MNELMNVVILEVLSEGALEVRFCVCAVGLGFMRWIFICLFLSGNGWCQRACELCVCCVRLGAGLR